MYPSNMIMNTPLRFFPQVHLQRILPLSLCSPSSSCLKRFTCKHFHISQLSQQFYHMLSTHLKYTRSIFEKVLF